jgi:hypothetical protein
MDYFKFAANNARAQAAAIPCRCTAYPFPHRRGSGDCNPTPIRYTTDPRPAWHREEEVIFNANEIRTMEKA